MFNIWEWNKNSVFREYLIMWTNVPWRIQNCIYNMFQYCLTIYKKGERNRAGWGKKLVLIWFLSNNSLQTVWEGLFLASSPTAFPSFPWEQPHSCPWVLVTFMRHRLSHSSNSCTWTMASYCHTLGTQIQTHPKGLWESRLSKSEQPWCMTTGWLA